MTTKLNIRYPNRKDLSELVRIERACHERRDVRCWTERDFIQFIGREGTRAMVAEEGDGNMVGFLLLDFSSKEELVLTRLTIDPNYRRNGFGSQLLERALFVNDKKLHRPKVVAYTYEEDTASQQFFVAKQFTSRLVRRRFGDKDAVRFSKS